MAYSQEDKKILEIISKLTIREDKQPQAIFLRDIITVSVPPEFTVCYDINPSQNSIWLKSNNVLVQDKKTYDTHLSTVILILFLLEELLNNHLIVCYENNESNITNGEFIVNKIGTSVEGMEYVSKHYKSPDFGRLINKFGNHKILPKLSLIELVKNDYKTINEIANEESLNKTRRAICISVIALIFTVITQTCSIIQTQKSIGIAKEGLILNKEALEIAKQSITKQKR